MTKTFTAIVLFGLLGACAKPERVILLPETGKPQSALTVTSKSGSATLAEPYAEAQITPNETKSGKIDADTVLKRYGDVITALPPAAKKFLVYFSTGSNELTTESNALLATIQAELGKIPGAEIVVIGHSDRVGTVESNDTLSAKRAEFIREKLIASGIPGARISTVGRGEREPLVPTEDEVAEPRNRRVEIKIR